MDFDDAERYCITIDEDDIRSEIAEWSSFPPAPSYALVSRDPYEATTLFYAWLAYPANKDRNRRARAIEAFYADGAFGAWRDKRITREERKTLTAGMANGSKIRHSRIQAAVNRANRRMRDAFEIFGPLMAGHAVGANQDDAPRSFYEIHKGRAHEEDQANFYNRRLKALIPVAHLAFILGVQGSLMEEERDVMLVLNLAEAMRRRVPVIGSRAVSPDEMVQFRLYSEAEGLRAGLHKTGEN